MITGSIDVPSTCHKPHTFFTLPSGLQVIVVEDPTTVTCAAAMSVGVGFDFDPVDAPGLAHFCEHMSFRGTTAYPDEAEYDKFVATHSGYTNAFTSSSTTTYLFQVSVEGFDGALDRFLHFFVDPLFVQEALERELEAVHSEDQKNSTADVWRMKEVSQCIFEDWHPAGRYGPGNRTTLKEDPESKGMKIRDILLDFHGKYYKTGGMCLCVYSPVAAKELMAKVDGLLDRIPKGPRPTYPWIHEKEGEGKPTPATCPIKKDMLATWTNIKSQSKRQMLRVNFPMPFSNRHKNHLVNATRYASHLVGHECKGSLLYVLKEENLVEKLSAGPSDLDDHWTVFQVSMSLTTEGLQRLDYIMSVLFQAVELVRRAGFVQWIDDEVVQLSKLGFSLADLEDPVSHAQTLAYQYQLVTDVRHAWSSQYECFESDPATHMKVLDFMTPANVLVVLYSHEFPSSHALGMVEPNKSTRFHDVQHSMLAIPPETQKLWFDMSAQSEAKLHPKLAMPVPNPYIAVPNGAKCVPDASKVDWSTLKKVPLTEFRTPYTRLAMKSDDRYGIPKASLLISMICDEVYASAKWRFFARILVHLVKDALTDTLYLAELAELGVTFHADVHGLVLIVRGVLGKLPVLLQTVLSTFYSSAIAQAKDKYSMYASRVYRELKTAIFNSPYSLVGSLRDNFLHPRRWQISEVHHEAQNSTYEEFQAFVAAFQSGAVFFDCMLNGDVDQTDAKTIVAAIEEVVASKVKPMAQQKSAGAEYMIKDLVQGRNTSHNVKALLEDDAAAKKPEEEKKEGKEKEETCSKPASTWLSSLTGFIVPQYAFNPDDENSCIDIAFQCAPYSPELAVIIGLYRSVVSTLFYNTLRGCELLGYVVYAHYFGGGKIPGMHFLVQSANHSVDYMFTRTHAFITAVGEHLKAKVEDDDIVKALQGMYELLSDYPKNLNDECEQLFEGQYHEGGNDYKEKEIAVIEAFRAKGVASVREQLAEFHRTFVFDAADDCCNTTSDKGCVAVFFYGAKQKPAYDALMANVEAQQSTVEKDGSVPVLLELQPFSGKRSGTEGIALDGYEDAWVSKTPSTGSEQQGAKPEESPSGVTPKAEGEGSKEAKESAAGSSEEPGTTAEEKPVAKAVRRYAVAMQLLKDPRQWKNTAVPPVHMPSRGPLPQYL